MKQSSKPVFKGEYPRKGYNPFEFLKGNFTMLQRAAKNKSRRAVKILLTQHLNSNEKNSYQPTFCNGNFFIFIR